MVPPPARSANLSIAKQLFGAGKSERAGHAAFSRIQLPQAWPQAAVTARR
jgi:hypothetical protein